jgi:hypothetical protein
VVKKAEMVDVTFFPRTFSIRYFKVNKDIAFSGRSRRRRRKRKEKEEGEKRRAHSVGTT